MLSAKLNIAHTYEVGKENALLKIGNYNCSNEKISPYGKTKVPFHFHFLIDTLNSYFNLIFITRINSLGRVWKCIPIIWVVGIKMQ